MRSWIHVTLIKEAVEGINVITVVPCVVVEDEAIVVAVNMLGWHVSDVVSQYFF